MSSEPALVQSVRTDILSPLAMVPAPENVMVVALDLYKRLGERVVTVGRTVDAVKIAPLMELEAMVADPLVVMVGVFDD